MSNEEKKAIESLKKDLDCTVITFCKAGLEDIKIVLNLIEKQAKEIEELKEENENLLDALNNSIDIRKYWVSKDKIKAKIEEIDREIKFEQNEKVIIWLYKQKRVLQSLL